MFIYNLSGLEIDENAGAPLEIEENETTYRSAIYQILGRLLGEPGVEVWEQARDGRIQKEFDEARENIPFELAAFDLTLSDDVDQAAFAAMMRAAFDGRLLGGSYGEGERDRKLEEINRAYEYFGLAAQGGALEPDHIVSECDYMQYITFREAAASSDRLQRSYRRAQREFLDAHLAWVSELPQGIEAGLARNVAELLAAFIGADREYVTGLLA